MSDQAPAQESSPLRPSRRGFLAVSAVAAAAGAANLAAPATAFADTANNVDVDTISRDWPTGPGEPITPQPPDPDLRRALRELERERCRANVAHLTAFGTRHTLSSQTDPKRGIGAARDFLFAQLQQVAAASNGRMTVALQSFVQPAGPRIPTPTKITNVVATLTGSVTPERIYVASAHYDSRVSDILNFTADAPGADDDASGVAAILEMARVMATHQSKATMVFALVAGEEQGQLGSAFMASRLRGANADVQGMFTSDIIGSPLGDDGLHDPRTIRLFAEGVPTSETPTQAAIRQAIGGENDGPSRQLARFVTNVANNGDTGMNVRIINRRDRFGRSGDHVAFLQQGYPAARFTEPHENFAHQGQDTRVADGRQFGDLIDFCDFDYILRATKVNLAAMWSLANGPGTPKNVQLLDNVLTNSSTLFWNRGTEPDLAGYEIVWRPTTAPDWTHRIPVGKVTSATVPLSKDNVFLGVRAVDTAGHHSPVAFPVPNP